MEGRKAKPANAVGRREFLAAMAAGSALGAAAAPRKEVGAAKLADAPKTWQGWKPGEFQIHLIHTGVAESQFLIFPDGTTMLIDCGDHAAITRLEKSVKAVPSPGRLAGDWIARYVKRVNPNGDEVDWIEPTHWHSDHVGCVSWQCSGLWQRRVPGCWRSGFGLAAETLHFRRAVDRGYPDYRDPIPFVDGDSMAMEHMRRLYAALAKRDGLKVEKFRLGATDQIVPVRGAADGFETFNLCGNGKLAMRDGTVLNVYADRFKDGKTPGWLNENGLSLGHIFTYGKFKYFTAGDFSDRVETPQGGHRLIEDDLAKAVPAVTVAKLNHHGHYSMPPSIIRALRPQAWTAGVWDQHHAVPNVLERLANPVFYPDRKAPLIFPSVFPEPRLTDERNAGYFGSIAPECGGDGCHIVVTVPRGGETCTISCIDASDEAMRIKGVYRFTV